MSKVLVIRLSAFGDVAMLVPVVYSAAKAFPDHRFVVLTRKQYTPLFEMLAENIETMTFDPQKKHKGISGLLRLLRSVKRRRFSRIADVHDVLRTQFLRTALAFTGKMEIAHIDKGRAEKKNLVVQKSISQSLISSIERYRQVFVKLGFDFQITFKSVFEGKQPSCNCLGDWKPSANTQRIGIAPFARHRGKIYPLKKMEQVVAALSKDPSNRIFLFGAGNTERHVLQKWATAYPNTVCTTGKLFLREELLLMNTLDVLVSMDSANMHLASLVETPVVSVWGATHPSLGFYGFGQKPGNAVQIDLDCRPCSVYGNKPCQRKDYACLNLIEPEMVLERIRQVLQTPSGQD